MNKQALEEKASRAQETLCSHCGEICDDNLLMIENKAFCCNGCSTVYQLINDKGLCDYYAIDSLEKKPSLKYAKNKVNYSFLDEPQIQKSLRLYKVDEEQSRIYLKSHQIHCSSCLYLLENLNKFNKAIIYSEAQFNTKTLAIWFKQSEIKLSEIANLLHSLGYPPTIGDEALNSKEVQKKTKHAKSNELLIRLGIAGFAAGNTMMLSFPTYLGLDDGAIKFKSIFLILNIILSTIVVFFSAAPWFKNAYRDLKFKQLGVDVPIALAVGTLYLRSLMDVSLQLGPGFFDSLNGLVFLLLIGKWLQTRYYEGLEFEHQYASYFPLSVKKMKDGKIEPTVLSAIKKGDVLLFEAGDLIPVDGKVLKQHNARIDSSFLNGETNTKHIQAQDLIYAGEKLHTGELNIQVEKEANQSYLYTLWNEASEEKNKETLQLPFEKFFVRYFTFITIGIAILAFFYWMNKDLMLAYNAFTAVLMVACPCALTLALPFAAGKAMTLLSKNGLFVKNAEVINKLAQIKHLVFDKTGTLTNTQAVATETSNATVQFVELAAVDNKANLSSAIVTTAYVEELFSIAQKLSAHPLLKYINQSFQERKEFADAQVLNFQEHIGHGIEFYYQQKLILIGSPAFCNLPKLKIGNSVVAISINGVSIGYYVISQNLRKGLETQLQALEIPCSLLTGDSFETTEQLTKRYPFFRHWNILSGQKPEDKFEYLKKLKAKKCFPLMIGDGMNDAAAMKAATVSLALVEDSKAFAPSSDAITNSEQLWKIKQWVVYAQDMLKMVKISFILSLVYNFIGVGLAFSGNLSPVFAAFFMPISSLSVVALAVILTSFKARKLK